MPEQSDFLFERLRLSEAKLGDGLDPHDAARLERNFQLLSESTAGTYALVDYVNFKGEGTKPSESYEGKGWGLRQVLLAMKVPDGVADAPGKFAMAAASVLRQRVKLSPPERNEGQYLPGWPVRSLPRILPPSAIFGSGVIPFGRQRGARQTSPSIRGSCCRRTPECFCRHFEALDRPANQDAYLSPSHSSLCANFAPPRLREPVSLPLVE